MLSTILSHANPNETSFTGLQDVAVLQGRIEPGLLAVDADAALLDEATSVAAAAGKPRLDQGADEVGRIRHTLVWDVVRHLVVSKPAVEVVLGAARGILTVQPRHELTRERRFGVARLQGQQRLLLARVEAGDQPHVLLDEAV